MNEINLRIGSEVFVGNSRYRIISVLDLEHLSIRSSSSGNVKKVHISEVSNEPKDPSKPLELIPNTELLTIDDKDWLMVQGKAILFNEVLQLDVEDRSAKLIKIAKKYNQSQTTIYRQLQKYKSNDGDPLCLLRKKRDDSGRLSDQVEEFVQVAITEYLSTSTPKITDIYRNLQLRIHKINKLIKTQDIEPFTDTPDGFLHIPHINTLRHRVSQLTASQIASKRKGKRGREDHRPIIGKFPTTLKPLQIVQIDHTPLDLTIVDDANRQDIGRPTLTLAIDVFSRMVTGFYISFEKPNTLLTGCCLTHAILDKKKWMMDHRVEGEWSIYGIPDVIHTDNGKEFHGKSLKRACELYNINMTKRPSGTPRYGGHIERLFKTFNDGGIHSLPGTTKSNIRDRGEYQSEKKAVMTLFEFETWFTEFIVNVYHKTVHSELGMSPNEKYKQGVFGTDETLGAGLPSRISDEQRLKIDFLPYEERSVQKYGIKMFGLSYYHDVLRKWIKQPDKVRKTVQKFIIRYDPRDLSSVFFYDPELKSYVVVPYRNIGNPAISLWELRGLKKKTAEATNNTVIDEEAIFDTYDRLAKIVEKSIKDTKIVRRKKQKEQVRQKESIPSQVKQSLTNNEHNSTFDPSFNTIEDDEFDDIEPFEELDQ